MNEFNGTVEQIGNVPQFRRERLSTRWRWSRVNEFNSGLSSKLEMYLNFEERETVDEVAMVPRERGQQWTVEQIGDVPQLWNETVEAVALVPRERVQQGIAEQIGSCTSISERDRRCGAAGPA